MKLYARIVHNGDHAGILWGPEGNPRQPFPDCMGFALYRRQVDEKGQPIDKPEGEIFQSYDGFDAQKPGTSQPSNVWPFQRFTWWDYDTRHAGSGIHLQYRVVGMRGTPQALTPIDDLATDWTETVTLTGDCGDGLSCYFNRGIVATQWVVKTLSKHLPPKESLGAALVDSISTAGNPLRDELGGILKQTLLSLLKEASDHKRSIYAALYELDDKDPELIPAVKAFGMNAHLILANGAFENKPGNDENAAARQELKGVIDIYDRMVSEGHFAHNKFVVFCDDAGKPAKVWTGSTNWARTGLCTQANNGLLIEDAAVAQAFREEWDLIKAAGNGFPAELVDANSKQKTFQVGKSQVTVWFVPTRAQQDLEHARKLINAAQDGALFLMFEPGGYSDDPKKWTLLQTILNRHQESAGPLYNPDFYIRGVVNQQIQNLTAEAKQDLKDKGAQVSDPTAPVATLINAGKTGSSPFHATIDVVAPAALQKADGEWEKEMMNQGVKIHSKMIVLDPFGAHPVVMTGSHNMGYKASTANDDNLIIIEGNSALAQAYATCVIAVYHQYRTNSSDPANFILKPTPDWQKFYFVTPDFEDMNFWLKIAGAQALGS